MSDVARKIINANGFVNNGSVTTSLPTGRHADKQRGINDPIPMSGVNGQTTNGYLDIRFDNPTYYTA